MAQIIGKVAMTPRGEYDPGRTYERLDIICYNGSTYVVLASSITGVEPTDGQDYMLLVKGSESVALDPTLTAANKAAQAKAVGDALDEVKGDLSELKSKLKLEDDTVIPNRLLPYYSLFEWKAWNASTKAWTTSTSQMSLTTAIKFEDETTIKCGEFARYQVRTWTSEVCNESTFLTATGWLTGEYTVPANTYFNVNVYTTSGDKISADNLPTNIYCDETVIRGNNYLTVNDDWQNLYTLYEKVGVIGDSFSAVRVYYTDYLNAVQSLGDIEEHSWVHKMGLMSNRTYKNFAKGGLECSQWLTDAEKGLPVASQSDNLCQAYIIALGINDSSRHDVNYIGTTADIDTTDEDNNANTFIGNYAKIIQKVKKMQRGAKIFLLTMATATTGNNANRYEAYNEAIRQLAEFFPRVYVIDLHAKYHVEMSKPDGFWQKNMLNSHYTPTAYTRVAKMVANGMSEVIRDHSEDFMYDVLIGTDKATKIWKNVI